MSEKKQKFQALSLRARVTVLALVVFTVGIWSFSLYIRQILQEDMLRVAGDQQQSVASFLAVEIDHELADRLAVMSRLAGRLAPLIHDSAALQQELESQLAFLHLFNARVYVTDVNGVAQASLPLSVARAGVNYRDRDYIAGALQAGRPTVGTPVVGRVTSAPVFGMAVPVLDAQGVIVGALAGITELQTANFLDQVTQHSFGKSGYVLLVNARNRTIITSSDRNRIMEKLPEPGVDPLIDRYISGVEETGVTLNPHGIEVLASSRQLSATDWYIVVAMPIEEALAPFYKLERRNKLAAILMTLLIGALTWLLMRRQLRPVHQAISKLTMLSERNLPLQALEVERDDEIGKLIAGFNRLLKVVAERESELRKSEHTFSTILDNINTHVFLKDTEGRYLFANRYTCEMFGAPLDEVIGQTDARFFDVDSFAQIRKNDRMVLDEGRIVRTEEVNLRGPGNEPQSYLTIKLPLRDEAGNVYALCGISTDISDYKSRERLMRQQAFHDELTGLPNRRLLFDRIDLAIAASRRSELYGALLFIDLDNFKPLNDRGGHEAGDLLLIEAARRLQKCVREVDTVARLGGDEFVVMVQNLDADGEKSHAQIGIIAEKIHAALSEPYRMQLKDENGHLTAIEHHCTASIGVCLFRSDEQSAEDILRRADQAMYAVKESGRNGIRFSNGQHSVLAPPAPV
jgi:diguanylate cyclase (GGDEF)-like protein/PAS domain S-box-containing protein